MKRSNGGSQIRHLSSGALLLGVMVLAVNLNAAVPTQFDFGTGAAAAGYMKVTPTTLYSSSQGYGFDTGSTVTAVSRGGSDVLKGDYCTGTSFSFSVTLPVGNYLVTLYIGDLAGTGVTTVNGEQRRLFIDRLSTASGQVVTKTFTINRRTYQNGSVTISRKDRELTYVDFDEKLTLDFSGSKPCVCGVDIVPVDTVITLYLGGNSTLVDQPSGTFCNWGQMLTRFFTSKVSIADYAESGEDANSFMGEKRFAMVQSLIKPGDYFFMEFGTNDSKSASLIASFSANLKTMCDATTAKNAIPVIVTAGARDGDTDSTKSIGGLAETARQTAKTLGVQCIDLNAMVITLEKALGANKSSLYVSGDPTHYCTYGGFELARIMTKGFIDAKLNIAQYLNTDLPHFDLTKPDPLNYLTTPTIGTGTIKPFEVKKTISDECGLSIALPVRSIQFTPGKTGNALFTIYSLAGKRIAQKRAVLTQAQGSMTWRELGNLPVGIYMVTMNVNNNFLGKVRFCTL
jgi:lysophospholipase L1-like esterase